MKGNLRDFSGTQILNLVSLAKKTGTLAVDRKDGKANLIFKDGKLIYAAIGDADGTLASVLARDGRISKEQADALAKRSEKTGDKQLGLLLIQKGYVSQADIIKSIKKHALAAVNQFASWRDGLFAFEQNRLPNDNRITVPLDLENIIIQIARVQKRDEALEDEIPSLDVHLKFVERPNVALKDLQLSKDEWRVLKFIKPDNTIKMIARSLEMNDRQIRRVIGSLREAGLVELVHSRKQREQMSTDQKQQKRALVGRLINHLQGIGAAE
jgi:DNA-binding MarR family transcriptional regulator